MESYDGEYSLSGKVRSYIRAGQVPAELHGLLSMVAGAWEINNTARVKAYCDNRGVVKGFKFGCHP